MININTKWQPKLDKKCNLKGPYPEVIDLCSENSLDLNFTLDPKIIISNDSNVKKIIAPYSQISVSYLSIKNLQNLEEIIVDGGPENLFYGLKWVTVNDCPLLKKISIKGGVISLTITGKTSLELLDISDCKDIDYVELSRPLPELKVDARGCLKLRGIIGPSEEEKNNSGILEQILDNQKLSRRDGSIYESMTFTDVDLVELAINDGVKALSRLGELPNENNLIFGFYGLMAIEKEFKAYSYRILEPLEPVYTGGTGETYGYVSREKYTGHGGASSFEDEVAGNKSPEDCLRYMLHSIRMLASHLPQADKSKDNELLAFLQGAHQSIEDKEVLGYPVKLSPCIEEEKRIELDKLISESGVKIADKNTNDYVYVYQGMTELNNENDEPRSEIFELNASTAIEQIKDLWYWRFKGKTVCLSGKAAKGKKKIEYEACIEAAGLKLVNEIRQGLAYLVHEDPDSTSRKVAQAKKIGISVISEDELRNMLMSKNLSR